MWCGIIVIPPVICHFTVRASIFTVFPPPLLNWVKWAKFASFWLHCLQNVLFDLLMCLSFSKRFIRLCPLFASPSATCFLLNSTYVLSPIVSLVLMAHQVVYCASTVWRAALFRHIPSFCSCWRYRVYRFCTGCRERDFRLIGKPYGLLVSACCFWPTRRSPHFRQMGIDNQGSTLNQD